MCGIFGYLGDKDAVPICLAGLKRLEYRGYDSSGIAGIRGSEVVIAKAIGNVAALEKEVARFATDLRSAIAHTRWATHGKPSIENAHPHLDQRKTLALVHNGVIENYAILRDELIAKGSTHFISQTDTEVIAELISKHYRGDILKATSEAISLLDGSYALAIIHKDHPGKIVAAALSSPLIVGYSQETGESFVASDANALFGQKIQYYFLMNGEMALLQKESGPLFFTKDGSLIEKEPEVRELQEIVISKEKFPHFMLKEIFEQEFSIREAFANRMDIANQRVCFEEIPDPKFLQNVDQIIIVACGTSWHAAYIASYWLEEIAHIQTRIEIASEYRYRELVVTPRSLLLALSQSGETADTLAAVRQVKSKKIPIIALCNVPGSSLTREADITLYLHAKPEVAVASTKTFTSQLAILYLFTIFIAKLKEQEVRLLLKHLYELPRHVSEVLANAAMIEELAKKYARFENFYFLGRNLLYPTALEAALKLKEIAYINATGYPAGEMKHGPIALLHPEFPVAAFCADERLQPKIMSNLMECKARGAPLLIFGWREFEKEILQVADDSYFIPKTSALLAPVPLTVATQLFAYYAALHRGCPIDQPRNLAKSVTVE